MLSRQPLRRLLVATVLLLLLPLGAAIYWAGTSTWLEREQEVTQQSATLASTVAASLDQYVAALHGLASSLTRHEEVIALDPERSHRLFAAVLADQPLLLNIALADRDERVVATATSSTPPPAQALVTTLPFVADVLRTGQPVVSDVFTTPRGRTPMAVLAFPVLAPGGAVVGVLGLRLDLLHLQGVFSGIPLPQGSVVTVVDRNRRVLVRTLESERFVGQAIPPVGAARSATDLDGVDRLVATAPLTRVPWQVMVGIPRADMVSRLSLIWRRNITVVLVALLVIVGVSMGVAVRMTRHLEDLRTAAQRIAGGDLNPPPVSVMPNLELDQLQQSFVGMAARLREARAEHERQVEHERQMNELLQTLQRQVVRQERLAAVGQLVSGVAHEMNNPLQAILGTSQLLERRPELTTDARDEIAFLQAQAVRAREIIRSLSRFSEPTSGPPEPVDLRDVIGEVAQLRAHELADEHIRWKVVASTSTQVSANFTELTRVVLNLVLNAEQAMARAATPAPEITLRVFAAGRWVRCEVEDNGPGVLPSDEPKLFQPFFTTQHVGDGTGLGLSLSYGIIQSYGGTIGYARNAAGGATFHFELPALGSEDDVQNGSAVLQPHDQRL
jgi:signal transduction histidine kinase